MIYIDVKVYTHFFKVTVCDPTALNAVREYGLKYIEYSYEQVNGRWRKVPKKIYAARRRLSNEFRFILSQLDDFLECMRSSGFGESKISLTRIAVNTGLPFDCSLPESWTPRENQPKVIEHIVGPTTLFPDMPRHQSTITLQTGKGKTTTALKAAELIGRKLMIIVLGKYHEKWCSDVKKNYGIDVDSGVVGLRGYKALGKFMDQVHNGLDLSDIKVYIFSTGAIASYIEEHKNTPPDQLPDWWIDPELIYDKLGVGVRIMDEVHLGFWTNYMVQLYTHCYMSIDLSATLKSDNEFEDKMYSYAYPPHTRENGGVYDKYVDAYAVEYSFRNKSDATYYGSKGRYSHVAFENHLMAKRNKHLLDDYLKMTLDMVITHYINARRDSDQKVLLYASTVKMCILIRDYLIRELNDPDLIISKYVSEDPDEVLLMSNISVSTLGSAGANVDIPGLICTIMTVAVDKRQANEQAIGRTRKIEDYPDQVPTFLYYVCSDIRKHVQYKKKKRLILSDKVLNHRTLHYATRLG